MELDPGEISLMSAGACGAFVHGLEDEFMGKANVKLYQDHTLDNTCICMVKGCQPRKLFVIYGVCVHPSVLYMYDISLIAASASITSPKHLHSLLISPQRFGVPQ